MNTLYASIDCIRVLNPVLARQMKAHISGIVARRVAASLHVAPIPSSISSVPSSSSLSLPPLLAHSTSLAYMANNSPRGGGGVGAGPGGLSSGPLRAPLSHPMASLASLPVRRSLSPAPGMDSTPVFLYPPLPVNPEEELIQCTFVLYVMLDALQSKMKDDDSVLRQMYTILPELDPIFLFR